MNKFLNVSACAVSVEKKVFFDNGNGVKLCGILATPTSEITPVVLLCHGLNSGKDSNTGVALTNSLSTHGIATFRFDFFAHGESDGDIDDRTVEEFINDVLQAVAYLKGAGYRRIGIYGASFGAVAAVIAASRISDIAALALKAAGMGQTSRKLSNYEHDFNTKSWIAAGASITAPTLIVHGTADKDVEIALAQELADSIPTSEFRMFKDADHRFTKKEDFDASVAVMADFFIAHLTRAY